MKEHIKFISHANTRILLVDFARCSPIEVENIARQIPDVVTTQPHRSVLMLVDFTGAKINQEALHTMEESAVFDKPFIKKSAWIGAEHISAAFYEQLKDFSRRDFPMFTTREEALNWLVKQ
jgi:hypothetical protein